MTPYYADALLSFYQGDVLDVVSVMPENSIQMVVTSPPYWGLRSYLPDGHPDKQHELGAEATPAEYVTKMVAVFEEVWRVLRDDGVVFLNIGDSYFGDSPTRSKSSEAFSETWDKSQTRSRGGGRRSAARLGSLKPKDLVGIPWRVAFALQDAGWYLRSEVTWCKRAPMPESVRDRPTSATEKIFLLTKSARYFYDAEAVKVASVPGTKPPGNKNGMNRGRIGTDRATGGWDANPNPAAAIPPFRNLWNYWLLSPEPFPSAHFAVFPTAIPRTAILAGSREGDTVLDPFLGSGTTALVAQKFGRKCIGIDLSSDYLDMAVKRCAQKTLWQEASA